MFVNSFLFFSLLAISSANNVPRSRNDQCGIVTKTYTGEAFWQPNPGAKASSEAGVSVGSWDNVLGEHPKSQSWAGSPGKHGDSPARPGKPSDSDTHGDTLDHSNFGDGKQGWADWNSGVNADWNAWTETSGGFKSDQDTTKADSTTNVPHSSTHDASPTTSTSLSLPDSNPHPTAGESNAHDSTITPTNDSSNPTTTTSSQATSTQSVTTTDAGIGNTSSTSTTDVTITSPTTSTSIPQTTTTSGGASGTTPNERDSVTQGGSATSESSTTIPTDENTSSMSNTVVTATSEQQTAPVSESSTNSNPPATTTNSEELPVETFYIEVTGDGIVRRFAKRATTAYIGFKDEIDNAVLVHETPATFYFDSEHYLRTGSHFVFQDLTLPYFPLQRTVAKPTTVPVYSLDSAHSLTGPGGFCVKDTNIYIIVSNSPESCKTVHLSSKSNAPLDTTTTSPTTTTSSITTTLPTTTTSHQDTSASNSPASTTDQNDTSTTTTAVTTSHEDVSNTESSTSATTSVGDGTTSATSTTSTEENNSSTSSTSSTSIDDVNSTTEAGIITTSEENESTSVTTASPTLVTDNPTSKTTEDESTTVTTTSGALEPGETETSTAASTSTTADCVPGKTTITFEKRYGVIPRTVLATSVVSVDCGTSTSESTTTTDPVSDVVTTAETTASAETTSTEASTSSTTTSEAEEDSTSSTTAVSTDESSISEGTTTATTSSVSDCSPITTTTTLKKRGVVQVRTVTISVDNCKTDDQDKTTSTEDSTVTTDSQTTAAVTTTATEESDLTTTSSPESNAETTTSDTTAATETGETTTTESSSSTTATEESTTNTDVTSPSVEETTTSTAATTDPTATSDPVATTDPVTTTDPIATTTSATSAAWSFTPPVVPQPSSYIKLVFTDGERQGQDAGYAVRRDDKMFGLTSDIESATKLVVTDDGYLSDGTGFLCILPGSAAWIFTAFDASQVQDWWQCTGWSESSDGTLLFSYRGAEINPTAGPNVIILQLDGDIDRQYYNPTIAYIVPHSSGEDPSTTTTTASDETTSTSATATTSSDDSLITTAPTPDNTTSTTDLTTTAPYLNTTTALDVSNSSTTSYDNTTTSTSTSVGPEKTFELEGPVSLGSVPPTVLDVVSPPDIDMGSLDRFDAQDTTHLWFNGANAGGDEEDGAVTVRVSMDYMHPSIVLDQSIYIKDITCTSSSIQGRISQADAYQKAQTAWTGTLIFITTTSSCVPDGESSFFFISSQVDFSNDGMTFTIGGSAADLADVFTNMAVDFGKIAYTVPDVVNSTDNAATSTCGSPSSPTINGLPAVACGTDFDKTLNDKLGYYSAEGDEQYVMSAIAPEARATDSRKRSLDSESAVKSELHKRSIWGAIVGFVKKVVQAVVQVVKQVVQAVVNTVVNAVVNVVQAVVKKAEEVILPVVKKVVDLGVAIVKQVVKVVVFVATGKYDQSLTLPINMQPPPNSLVESPWGGKALKFYTWQPGKGGEKWNAAETALENIQSELLGLSAEPEPGIEFYCVNCGISGKIVATGSIEATPASGLKKASVGIHGNMYAGVYLGVNAFAQYEKKYEKELYTKGLPGWSIPGIVNLGPMLTLGVEAGITVEAEGQLLAGASLNWPGFEAVLDFVDKSNSHSSGWVPDIDHKLTINGKLSAEASLGLPVSVEFGIDILNHKWKRTVALTDTPAIAASASLSASYDVDTGASIGDGDCPGIAWDLKFKNELTLGFKSTNNGETEEGPEFKLTEWDSPALASGCISLGPSGGSGGDQGSSNTGDGGNNGGSGGNNGGSTSTDTGGNGGGSTTEGSTVTTSTTSTGGNSGSTSTVSIPSIPTLPADPSDDDTKCVYWQGKQWTDSRSNSWDVKCHVDASSLLGVRIVNSNAASSMLECFESCHYGNFKCEQAYWQEEKTTCHLVKTDGVQGIPTSAKPCSIQNGNCPINFASADGYFTAVSTPITPFVIHAVEYGNFDIQTEARAWWNKGHWLEVGVDWYWQVVGDPFPYVQKSYFAFYQYGPESRLISALETDNFVIHPGPAEYPAKQRVVADPNPLWQKNQDQGGRYAKIWDVAWGGALIDPSMIEMLITDEYWFIANRHDTLMSNTFWRVDNWSGGVKIGCFFAERNDLPGIIYSVCNRDGQVVYSNSFGSPMKKRDDEPTPEDPAPIEAEPITTTDTGGEDPDNGTSAPDTANDNNGTSSDTNADLNFLELDIRDTTDTITLHPGKDGNIWASTANTSAEDIALFSNGARFAGVQQPTELIMGDGNENILHYFPDEYIATGVSRLRLAKWDKIPLGALMINLVPVTSGDATILVGTDTQGTYGFLYFCGIENQLNRIFLVNDPLNGAAAVMNEGMKYVVTGGQATDCVPLALVPHWLG